MAEIISDAQTETNNSSKKDRAITIGFAVVIGAAALAMPVGIVIDGYQWDKQRDRDAAPATAAAKADGFDLTYFDGGDPDYATVYLQIPSRSGASCEIHPNVLITRDANGQLVDLHQYSMTGYRNPHMVRQGVPPHQREVVGGDPYPITFENLAQLQSIAGGPQQDFCADQASVAEFQATPAPTN